MKRVEINANFQKANDTFSDGNKTLIITPPLDEDYWIYRVPLKHGQAIVAFPKFCLIGCGFAKEENWNTNLPISCDAKEIFNHIKHNKKYKDIKDSDCIAAIEAIQSVVKEMAQRKEKTDERE